MKEKPHKLKHITQYDSILNIYNERRLDMKFWVPLTEEYQTLGEMTTETIYWYIKESELLKNKHSSYKAIIYVLNDVLHKRRFMKIDRIKNKIK